MAILQRAWRGLGEDPAALALVHDVGSRVPLSAVLPVGALVHDVIAAASLSAALLAARRSGSAVAEVALDPVRVATAVTSERHFRQGGRSPDVWAELSGFWPVSDGWVRTHTNYPHHRAALLTGLGLPEQTTADELRAALRDLRAAEVEERVTAAGGVAVAVRREEEWAPPDGPPVQVTRVADAAARPLAATDTDAPARGIRVLDFTRVVAGPVATRTLALWGADVLRVDSPRLPEIPWQHLDSGAGKRSTVLDLEQAADRDRLEALLRDADVVVTGYRPGALDRFGLSPEGLASEFGLVIARLSAWGAGDAHRGFDSIVQAASGISWIESADDATPGALPAQALDHGAGYLLAAGITTALRRRIDEGGDWLVETDLVRVAAALLAEPRGSRLEHPPWQPTVVDRGIATTAAAAPHYDGGPDDWSSPPVAWGSSEPVWLE